MATWGTDLNENVEEALLSNSGRGDNGSELFHDAAPLVNNHCKTIFSIGALQVWPEMTSSLVSARFFIETKAKYKCSCRFKFGFNQ